MSRLRRPAGRLRDLPIWSKLGLIMIVPTLATIVVGTSGLVDHINTAKNADRARTLAQLSEASGALVDNLQNERAYAVMSLAAPDADKAARDRALKAYTAANQAVDDTKRPYSQQRTALSEVPGNLRDLLGRIDASLEELPATRSQVVNGKLKLSDAAKTYEQLLAQLLDIRTSAAQLAGDPVLSDEMRAASSMAQVKEYQARQRIVVHDALSLNALSSSVRRAYIATQTGAEQELRNFRSVATQANKDLYNQTVTGPELREAVSWTSYLDSKITDSLNDAPFTPATWDAAMLRQAKLVGQVESQLDKDIVSRATTLRDRVQQRVLVETGVLLGMLLLAILFAWLVARSMARSLRELRQGALSVAQYGLPQAVARLRDPTLSSQLSPVQVANQIAEPLPVRSRDEFGQVTEAFNAVHLEAVRTAAEQAALRASVSTMFVNLARRSQILVDRLIGHLDRLERGEEDPDRLAELFQLDHLATRMRRNDENLLVLAGADSTRIQREPAALMDVLRAAQSEVEHYTRIEFGLIDREIEVSAHAVNDLVHLVAELFDNATAFSPPDSHIMVEARRAGDRAILHVADRGIGISADQLRDLNEKLSTPPMVDVTVSRMMGLVVVARLASRHGVRVELQPAPDRGTVAEVALPAAVLVPRALAGRLQQGGATAFDTEPAAPSGRPTFAAPLALEGAPAGARPPAQREAQQPYPAGRPFDPNPPLNGGELLGAGSTKAMPAWSDLTGANGTNGTNGRDVPPSRPVNNGHSRDALPQRQPTDPWTVDGEVANGEAGATIPRQLPAGPDAQRRGPSVPPVSAPPMAAGPHPFERPAGERSPFDRPAAERSAFERPSLDRPVSGVPGSDRPVSGVPVSANPVSANPVSANPVSVNPVSASPVSGAPVSAMPVSAAPVSAVPVSGASNPPLWPPVAGDREPTGSPVVPERLAAALDLTAELPRVVRPGATAEGARPASAPGALPQRPVTGQSATEPASARSAPAKPPTAARPAPVPVLKTSGTERRVRYADETMELPIFRELESAWFRTGRSAPKEPAGAPAAASRPAAAGPGSGAQQAEPVAVPAPAEPAVPVAAAASAAPARPAEPGTRNAEAGGSRNNGTSRAPQPSPGKGTGVNGGAADADVALPRRPVTASPGWQTAADDGWRAATAAADTPVAETTRAGLPKRTPMAQLVPGGVDKAASSVQRRTPESVRGLLSAYHRGVQRGRTKDHPTNAEETPGWQSSQAGKEHEG